MKHMVVLVVLSVASVGLCADPKAPKADKALNGRWTPESAVMAGKEVPRDTLKSMHLVLARGKYTLTNGDQVDEGTYKVDESEVPKTITFVGTKGPQEGKTMLGIYELEDGKLRICFDTTGKTHPVKFESKADSQVLLATYTKKMAKAKRGALRRKTTNE
ncbi:MAG TPA: TIGR03067 domain-containing protein [Planctomycetaceae bacterium]|jgi:uncharacterized protein (TIGR03067 family)|nr:TIGR03067 domain-containing protein [Planctomycetaceae bacterium]